jgi:hypothetical protein
MSVVAHAQATGVTIAATIDGGGGDWSAQETYPVVLGWGVELIAPGVYFLDADGGGEMMFDVQVYPGDPMGSASVAGAAANPIGVGLNSAQTVSTTDGTAIAIEKGATLYLANASVTAADNGSGNSSALQVGAGGTLWLGQDQSATQSGTVYVGGTVEQATLGYIGINCLSDTVSLGGTVSDVALVGQSAVVIQGQSIDLWLNDYSQVSLTSAPMLGAKNCLGGTYTAAAGAVVDGHSKLSISNGTVQCMGFAGFGTSSNTPGNPTITLDNTVIQRTAQGVVSMAGQINLTDCTLRQNLFGVSQYFGTIDLSGGGNTVVCSSNQFFGGPSMYGAGVDVYNGSSTNLPADNVAWDSAAPDYYSCDANFGNCTCLSSSCALAPNSDGMDAVEDSTLLGGITTSGNTYADAGCE